ncbi:hypothetical protein RB195_017366 [Necator americanus]|uniref:Uncharacterized protein n=1 Tax=Necator americanus TaxID=51031 RepID=A0ABR1C8I0_NECAM
MWTSARTREYAERQRSHRTAEMRDVREERLIAKVWKTFCDNDKANDKFAMPTNNMPKRQAESVEERRERLFENAPTDVQANRKRCCFTYAFLQIPFQDKNHFLRN